MQERNEVNRSSGVGVGASVSHIRDAGFGDVA